MQHQTIEAIPFIWGVAFIINVLLGALSFSLIIRRAIPPWSAGVTCWVGWWSWATAMALVVNFTYGPDNPFSYHQLGVLTETMENIGVSVWIIVTSFRNWYVTDADWKKMETLRADLTIQNIKKDRGLDESE